MIDPTHLIGVDWGTTHLRVMRIGDHGEVLDRRLDGRGAGVLSSPDYKPVLDEVAGDWLERGWPVLICGMAGARGGWRETPYVNCPAEAGVIARALSRPKESPNVSLVPGVGYAPNGRLEDVMRGEETQALGVFGPDDSGVLVAPGTHSKWCRVEDGVIHSVTTHVTGELFSAVRHATVLGAGMVDSGLDDDAFDRGVVRGFEIPALSHALFSVRVERLADRLAPEGGADYLSGLLIGSELRSGLRGISDACRIHLVGSPGLTSRYERAFDLAGSTVTVVDAETATARGLWRLLKEFL